MIQKCRNCGKEFDSRKKYCEDYHKNRKHIVYVNDKRTVEGFLKSLLRGVERQQKLAVQDLISLYNAQKGLCAVSGVPMTTIPGNGRHFKSTNISLDRKDSSKGYELENVQLTCTIVNIMKNSFSKSEFLWWCKQILKHHGEFV